MLHGDLGTYGVGTSNHVTDLVAKALPITLQLTFLGLLFAVLISFPLGVLAACTVIAGPTRSSASSR